MMNDAHNLAPDEEFRSETTDTHGHASVSASTRASAPAMNLNDWERMVSIVAGLTGFFLLSRRLLIHLALAALSGYLLYRGLTGYCFVYDKANLSTRNVGESDDRNDDSPMASVTERWRSQTHDIVEEASWESFPASDPPAFN